MRRWSRRDLLRRLGVGGAAVLGAGLVGSARAEDQAERYRRAVGISPLHRAGLYGGAADPPAWMGPEALDAVTAPPVVSSRGRQIIEMTVMERTLEVAEGVFFDAWTYDGTVPGPTLRATEGDVLEIRFRNRTDRPHNLHFHGRHAPTQDGWEPVPPGGEATYEIVAGPAGLHPYHCHVMPLQVHVARGLYGLLIVDPPTPRPAAQEVVLMLSGFEVDGEPNAVVAWNGVAGFYERFPIKVQAGEPVRVYLANVLEYEPVGSFHLHAETFRVFPTGIGAAPAFETDVVTLGQMDRAVLEFTLPEPGRYMFHPHQHWLAERGAVGWFAAV